MLNAIDQAALVAESELEDFGVFQIRPQRVAEASGRRREDLVDLVLLVRVQPDPVIARLDQADFLGAVILVLFAVAGGLSHWHDADSAARKSR